MSVTVETSEPKLANAAACPQCGQRFLSRCQRTGVMDAIFTWARMHPFRCRVCGVRFYGRISDTSAERTAAVERRELERVRVQLPATLWHRRARAQARVVQLSLRGCTIETALIADRDASLKLEVRPPGAAPIVVEAVAVRSIRSGALGVEFVTVRPAEAARLRDLVLEALAKSEGDQAARS